MPQNRTNILCTKDLDEASIQNALSKSIYIDVIPFIRTEPALTTEVLDEVRKASIHWGTVIFTSANAVETVMTILDQPKIQPEWKIFCIGYGTRRSVEKYFGEGSIAGVADNAKALAKTIVKANVPGVIFFCGDQRRDELPDELKKNNVVVTEIEVYKTILTPRKIEKEYDGVLFFSPSAVKSFFQLNKGPDKTVLFAIGNTTADEIKRFSKNKIVVSDVPTGETLINRVISYFQMNSIHH